MYTTELQELLEATSTRLEESQRGDLERERARLECFETLLKYIDQAHGDLIKVINDSFTTVRAEIASFAREQRAHVEKMALPEDNT